MTDEYPTSRRNRVRQLREYAVYDRQTVHDVIDSAVTTSVGFVEDGSAVVVPMLFDRDGETIYLHGARKARIIKWLAQNSQTCLNVTRVDGLVFARSAFNSSLQYRSATVFGTPRLVDDPETKLHALRVISEHAMPGRWEELRAPHARELSMTGVIAVEIETASAKISAGMPEDEEEDYEIPIWAGVLPLRSTYTQLISDDRVADGVAASANLQAMQNKVV